jgi:hypothetical protein
MSEYTVRIAKPIELLTTLRLDADSSEEALAAVKTILAEGFVPDEDDDGFETTTQYDSDKYDGKKWRIVKVEDQDGEIVIEFKEGQ